MCRNACVQVWPWLYVLLAFAPHLGCPFGMTCSPAHARASRHTHQASLDAYYIYFFKITDQLASLTFIFLLLHVSSTISLPFHPKKRGFVHHYLITIEIPVSHSLYLAFHLTSHAPQILIPSLFMSFRVPATLGGWAESELGIFCWKVLTATIKWLFDLQTIMELGLLTRCKGLLLSPISSFCSTDA